MGLWRPLKLAAACCLAVVANAQAFADSALLEARQALNSGDLVKASAAYDSVHADGPDWPERLIDSWRFHFIAGRYTEAWRFTELALRSGVSFRHLGYMRLVSEMKARVCTLAQEAPEDRWQDLLAAYVYRFSTRYQAANYRADPLREAVSGPLTAHMGPLELHYLDSIPRAVLIPGTGCRWYAGGLKSREDAEAKEFDALYAWYLSNQPLSVDERLVGYEAVELRLLELAVKRKEGTLVHDLLTTYGTFKTAAWLRTPEPERRYVWQQLVAAGIYPKPPYAGDSEYARVVAAIVMQSETVQAAEWMGLLDSATMKTATRDQLYNHLLTIAGIPSQPYLLVEEARSAYLRGEVPEALGFIRRLLLLEEAEGDGEVEAASALLAARIFAEYSYDEGILGALQNTLPSGTWGAIFRKQLLVQALTGNGAGFDQLQKTTSGAKQQRAVRLSPEQTAVLATMAHRSGGAFAANLQKFTAEGRTSGANMMFFADLGAEVVALSPEERRRVDPYLRSIGNLLRSQVNRGQNQRTLLELVRLFNGPVDAQSGPYTKGSETAREGTVTVGVADLTRAPLLAYPFQWSPPVHLALRDLIVVPSDATGRAWQIR